MNQLKPNTYTICETTQQCKELFDWANNNGVSTYATCDNNETVLSFSDDFELISDKQNAIQSLDKTYFFIPLYQFTARLKGEWIEGKTVTLSIEDWETVVNCLYGWNMPKLAANIDEQLNNQ